MKDRKTIPAIVLTVAFAFSILSTVPDLLGQGNRLFEIRTYTTHEGKLGDLNKRFREHTNHIFVRHGMTLVGYWTPNEGPEANNTLVYILAYPSREARDRAWQAFRDDPEWQKAARESRSNGRLVKNVKSTFLSATDYSPIQ